MFYPELPGTIGQAFSEQSPKSPVISGHMRAHVMVMCAEHGVTSRSVTVYMEARHHVLPGTTRYYRPGIL
eukprot:941527-Amorphochlora_amoeboformis.AAC.1